MGWLITLLLLSPVAPASGEAVVPSRELTLPAVPLIQEVEPVSFDLIDYRQSLLDVKKNIRDEDPHSIFVIKRHIGVSAGYDNTVLHGSVGMYLTVAELGRWNFGVPSVGFGWGRYPIYDRAHQQAMMKAEPTVFVSVASVHYRLGYLRQFGVNWYLNLEQVYDLRYNMSGSQVGLSFSTK